MNFPCRWSGPTGPLWIETAKNTVTLVNEVDSIELLANPEDYSPNEFVSIGEFIRQISRDFTKRRVALLRSTRKPLKLTVLFASESSDAGVLTQLTSSARFGLLDASALVHVTADSELGRWWTSRRGLLTQTIVQLDAHAFTAPPAVTVPILRSFGNGDVIGDLTDLRYSKKSPGELLNVMKRSDIGRHLQGERRSSYETRGNPGENSRIAFELLVDKGYIRNGKDKQLNASIGSGLIQVMTEVDPAIVLATEKKLEFAQLIPDVSFEQDDMVHCLEFAWRAGEFLRPANRADTAIYLLNKLRSYARNMQWTDA